MTSLLSRILSAPRRFWADDSASLSIEAAIMLPVLSALYVSGYQYFDGYRREAQISKANYAIADLISREDDAVYPAYLQGLKEVYEAMTDSAGTSYMRFSQVVRTPEGMRVDWSWATDGQPKLTETRLQSFLSQIPTLDQDEKIILVESYTYDRPFFDIGLRDRIIDNFTPVSARYEGCVVFKERESDPNPGCQIGDGNNPSDPGGNEGDASPGGGVQP